MGTLEFELETRKNMQESCLSVKEGEGSQSKTMTGTVGVIPSAKEKYRNVNQTMGQTIAIKRSDVHLKMGAGYDITQT